MTCRWMAQQEAARLTLNAFKAAMAEFGIAAHPDGKCPSADCPCERLADAVEARAIEIIEQQTGRQLAPEPADGAP